MFLALKISIFRNSRIMTHKKRRKSCGINLQILDHKYLARGPFWWEFWHKRKKPRYGA
jgi:hypothetical protein